MATQFRPLYTNGIIEKGFNLQKVCLGGKIETSEDVSKRLDTAQENMFTTCFKCKIACLEEQCPVKNAHRQIMKILFKIDDNIFIPLEKENPMETAKTDIFPYIDANEYSLDWILEFYNEGLDKFNKQNNPGPITGLDKIKTFFGGK